MGFLAFHAWLLVPMRYHGSAFALWLLQYAGEYAFAETPPPRG